MAKKRRNNSARKQPLKAVQGKAPVSLCMIVKNEERFLEDCLKSVENLVSEMIIVDTGSTDDTIAIARKYGARVFEIEWENDFAKARNAGLQHATRPWILYLDADERLHPHYHPLVKQAVKASNIDAYYLRVSSEVGELLGSMPHVQAYPRLFRRKPGIFFVGRIHEQITPSIRQMNGNFGLLDVEIEHLGYNLSPAEMAAKVKRNLASLEVQVADEPQNAYARFQLGQTRIIDGDIANGKIELHKALEIKGLSEGLEATIILILANEDFKEGAIDTAIQKIQKAIQLAPSQRLGYFLLSECYAKQERFEAALATLQTYWKYAHDAFSDISVDKVVTPYLIYQRQATYAFHLQRYPESLAYYRQYFNHATLYRANALQRFLYAADHCGQLADELPLLSSLITRLEHFDEPQEAIESLLHVAFQKNLPLNVENLLQNALRLFPDVGKYDYFMGNVYLERNDLPAAERWFEQALAKSPETYEIYYNLAVVAIKQQKYLQAIDWFEQIAKRFPVNAALACRRLAGLYMKVGDAASAARYATLAKDLQDAG